MTQIAEFLFEGAAGDGWNTIVGGGGAIDVVVFYQGAQSLYFDTGTQQEYQQLELTSIRTIVGRMYLRLKTDTSGTATIISCPNVNGDLQLQLRVGRQLRATVGATLGSNSAITLSLDTWYRIDFSFDSSGATATADYQIDGSAQTGASRAQTAADMSSFRLGNTGTNSYQAYTDALTITDNLGDYPLGDYASLSQGFAQAQVKLRGTMRGYGQAATQISGDTIYVSTTGNDTTGDGSFGTPYLTLNKAFTVGSVGCIVYMRGGTYSNLFFNGRDTVTVTNYPSEDVIIRRSSSGNVLNFENCRNLTFRQNTTGTFTVEGVTSGNGSNAGIRLYYLSSATDLFGMSGGHTIDGLTIHAINGYGIYGDDLTSITVQNCSITDTATGIMLKRVDTGLITYNDIYDNRRMVVSDATGGNDFGAMGVALDVNTTAVEVSYNTIHGNYATSIDYGIDGGAIEVYSSTYCNIHHNIMWDNEGTLETGSNQSTFPIGHKFHHNIVYGRVSFDTPAPGDSPCMLLRAAESMLIYNNTFDVDDGTDIFRIQEGTGGFFGPISNLEIKNNIIRSNGTALKAYVLNKASLTSTIYIDYNLVYNSNGSSTDVASRVGFAYDQTEKASWTSAVGYSTHDIWGSDPNFTDRTGRDYTLASNSPAINAGTVLSPYTDGYSGAAPDMGESEFETSTQTVQAQAQADIKQTYRAYAQANAEIKQTYRGFAQAQAQIQLAITLARGFAQSSSLISRTDNLWSAVDEVIADDSDYIISPLNGGYVELKLEDVNAPIWRKQHYIIIRVKAIISGNLDVFLYQGATEIANFGGGFSSNWTTVTTALSQGEMDAITDYSDLRIRLVPEAGSQYAVSQLYLQLPTEAAAKYNVFAQAQVQIKQISKGYSQAQAQIKTAYQDYAQAQTDIKSSYLGNAQAQARIKTVYQSYAQAQAKIATTRVFGQAQADIKTAYLGFAQAAARITGIVVSVAQAQTQIKTLYQGFAQSQTTIKQITLVTAQAQSDIKQTYRGFAQANTYIKTTNLTAFAQTATWVKTTAIASAQAQAYIKIINIEAAAQAQVYIKVTGNTGFAQAQTDIKQTYQGYAQSQADIKQTYRVFAQANTWIKETSIGSAQAQAWVEITISQFAQSQVHIKTMYIGSAQAQAKIKAFGVQAYAQAQTNLRFNGNTASAQAQAKINAFGVQTYGQSQADIKSTYQLVAQAQTDIKQTYQVFAQAGARIKNTYQNSAQVQAAIETTYQQFAQANARITGIICNSAQAMAAIEQTYKGFAQAQTAVQFNGTTVNAQAQARIKAFNVQSYAQAQSDIKALGRGAAQALADIKVTTNRFAQAQAQIQTINVKVAQSQVAIKSTSAISAQAQVNIKTSSQSYAQAQARIGTVGRGVAQAQAYIRLTGLTSSAQVQAQIKATYKASAQALANIKTSYQVYASAQAIISTTVNRIAQAQTEIKHTYIEYAQAQATIITGGRQSAQAQTYIKIVDITAIAQAMALIIKAAAYAQAQAFIYQSVFIDDVEISDVQVFHVSLSDILMTGLVESDIITSIKVYLSDIQGLHVTLSDILDILDEPSDRGDTID